MTKAISSPRARRNIWMFAFLALVFAYLSQLGMTFNGILALPDLQPFTLGMFGLSAMLWLVVRWRSNWKWYQTPLDVAMLLWTIALVASIVMNPHTFRRSMEGMWYVILYLCVWYVLCDALANGGLSRQTLVQSFLFAGLITMVFGWFTAWLILSRDGWTSLPRPSGLIGNPNAFAAIILALLPFSIVQTVYANKRFPKFMMGLYTLSAFLLLILSQSRGAWIGFGGSFGVLMFLLFAEHNMLSGKALANWWNKQSRIIKIGLVVALVILILLGLFMVIFVVQSLSDGGRSLSLRTYLWSAALSMFSESPIWGKGFYTYGQYLPNYASIPPTNAQAHAHNLPLNVMAEMGLLGLLAIIATIILAFRAFWRNWKHLSGGERAMYIAGVSAVVGFGLHHLLDLAAMFPIIALTGVLVLVLAVEPAEPTEIKSTPSKIGRAVGLVTMWVFVLVAGFWNINLYGRYIAILQQVASLNDCRVVERNGCELVDTDLFLEQAMNFQPLVDADPRQPAYILQQAYLYGLAASEGDTNMAELAIAGYERYLALEPTHASAWSNLAALYWQVGNQAQARSAIEQAIRFAPDWPHFKRQRDIYVGVITDAETITPPIPVRYSENWSRLQYLREPLPEYLPQVGWGS